MLMNLGTDDWDEELLKDSDIPRAMLPKIVPSQGRACQNGYRVLGSLIPIAGIAGDQQAALFGQACFEKGLLKNTYGTGCFALLHPGPEAGIKAQAAGYARFVTRRTESVCARRECLYRWGDGAVAAR